MPLQAAQPYSTYSAYNPRLAAHEGDNPEFSSSMIKTGSVFAASIATIGAFFFGGAFVGLTVALLSGTGLFFLFQYLTERSRPGDVPFVPFYQRAFQQLPRISDIFSSQSTIGRSGPAPYNHRYAQGPDGTHVVPDGGRNRRENQSASHGFTQGPDGTYVVPGGGRNRRVSQAASHGFTQGPDGTYVVPGGGISRGEARRSSHTYVEGPEGTQVVPGSRSR